MRAIRSHPRNALKDRAQRRVERRVERVAVIEPFHLQAYADEECFRYNQRKLNDAGALLRLHEANRWPPRAVQ